MNTKSKLKNSSSEKRACKQTYTPFSFVTINELALDKLSKCINIGKNRKTTLILSQVGGLAWSHDYTKLSLQIV